MNAVARIPDRVTPRSAGRAGPGGAAEPGPGADGRHAPAPRRWTSFRKPKDRMKVPTASTTAMAAA